MESKDEVSDTDSGIILQSGPDSPVSPAKELTHAVRKQLGRLEACLEELRRLCLREAELTGTLPAEYPLKPGEKAPKVRRRIGAVYRLDERLHSITARNTQLAFPDEGCCWGGGGVGQAWLLAPRSAGGLPHLLLSPLASPELSASDDSSLSDGLLLEEETPQGPKPPPESSDPPPRPLPPQSLEGLQLVGPETGGLERAPIQNSPWKETSLDHPYEKPRRSSEAGSESSSPATTPQDGPSASSLWLLEPASYYMVPIRSVPGQRQGRTSAPATPEMQGRRGQSQSLRPRRCRVNTRQVELSTLPAPMPGTRSVSCPSCPLGHPDMGLGGHPGFYVSLFWKWGTTREPLSALSRVWRALQGACSTSLQQAAALRPRIPAGPAAPPSPAHQSSGLQLASWAWQHPGPGPRPHPPADMLFLSCELGPVLGPGPGHPNLPDGEGDGKGAGRGGQGACQTPTTAGGNVDKGDPWAQRASWEAGAAAGQRPYGTGMVWPGLPSGCCPSCSPIFPFLWPWQVPTVRVLRRSPEGAPVQIFIPENGEVVSQV
uniref:Innate immunity activator protein n=1 Tax=Camelus bactrianus TaxID=9837 RepID=A0A9W3G754_CAMBA|nr:innate immunity activator protein [Camelus bactrianus]